MSEKSGHGVEVKIQKLLNDHNIPFPSSLTRKQCHVFILLVNDKKIGRKEATNYLKQVDLNSGKKSRMEFHTMSSMYESFEISIS